MRIVFLAVLAGFVGAQDAAAGQLWVSNEKDNTVSVVDTQALTVVATYPVGLRPRGITFSHDFKELYLCASDDDQIDVLDPASGLTIRRLTSGEDPEQFALHPNDTDLYIANEDDALATVMNVKTGEVLAEINVGVEPEGMAVSPDGTIAVVTSETTNMVHWIDTAKKQIFANTLVGQRPRHAEFSHDGKQLWVSSEVGGQVQVLDVATQSLIKELHFAIGGVSADLIQPVGIRLTADGSMAFVALGPANHVAVVDTKSFAIKRYILVGARVWHLEFTDNEKMIFSVNGASGDVTAIDVARLEAVKSIKVGRYPWGAAYHP